MTDEQIIKALECCAGDKMPKCRECPLFESGTDCIEGVLEKSALDYINRLRADNEHLAKERNYLYEQVRPHKYGNMTAKCVASEFCYEIEKCGLDYGKVMQTLERLAKQYGVEVEE